MAYIKKKSERKFKITVCNGYKVNGQKRMKAQTITVHHLCQSAAFSSMSWLKRSASRRSSSMA